MPSFVARWSRVVAALLLALAVLLPAVAEADTFVPPNFEGNGAVGQDPTDALAINGTVQNSLIPGQPVWYQITYGGPPPLAVTVDTNPSNLPAGAVQMHVDWQTPNGTPDVDWPGFYRIGEGTSSGYGPGVLHWLTGANSSATYYVELINTSNAPVGYAIALTNRQIPPPVLNPPPPPVITSS